MAAGAAVAAGLVVTACSVDNPIAKDKSPQKPAALAPDVAVATSALAEIKVLRAAVTTTVSRFPATRAQLTPLLQLHRAHEVSLADAVPARAASGASPAPVPYAVPRKRDVALSMLLAREGRLHASLDALALRAQSGDFAQLLASMGAGIGQQLAVLPP
ncbi:MAG: hypothetical protein JWR90_737 [Marmoricola sp.]|nr:hypothetical protein [Marmoricola sp.]